MPLGKILPVADDLLSLNLDDVKVDVREQISLKVVREDFVKKDINEGLASAAMRLRMENNSLLGAVDRVTC